MATQKVFDMESVGLPNSDSLGINCYISEKGIQGIPLVPSGTYGKYIGSFVLNDRTYHLWENNLTSSDGGNISVCSAINGVRSSIVTGTSPAIPQVSGVKIFPSWQSVKSFSGMVVTNPNLTFNGINYKAVGNSIAVIGNGTLALIDGNNNNALTFIKAWSIKAPSYQLANPNDSVLKIRRYQLLRAYKGGYFQMSQSFIPSQYARDSLGSQYRVYGMSSAYCELEIQTYSDMDDNVRFVVILSNIWNPKINVLDAPGDRNRVSVHVLLPANANTKAYFPFKDASGNIIVDQTNGTLSSYYPTSEQPFGSLYALRPFSFMANTQTFYGSYVIGNPTGNYSNRILCGRITGAASTGLTMYYGELPSGVGIYDDTQRMSLFTLSIPNTGAALDAQIKKWYNDNMERLGNGLADTINQNKFYLNALCLYVSSVTLPGTIDSTYSQPSETNIFALRNRLFSLSPNIAFNTQYNKGQAISFPGGQLISNIQYASNWQNGQIVGTLNLRRAVNQVAVTDDAGNAEGFSFEQVNRILVNGQYHEAPDPLHGDWYTGGQSIFDYYFPANESYGRKYDNNALFFSMTAMFQWDYIGAFYVVPSNVADSLVGVWGKQRDMYAISSKSVEHYQISDNSVSPVNWVNVLMKYDNLADWCGVNCKESFNIIYQDKGNWWHNGINRVRRDLISKDCVPRPDTSLKGVLYKVFYDKNRQLCFIVDEKDRIFRVGVSCGIYNLSIGGVENYFASEQGGPPSQVDIESGGTSFEVEWINRTPENCLIKEISIESTQYEGNSLTRQFWVSKKGFGGLPDVVRNRTSAEPLVKFFNFGKGGADRYMVGMSAGYMKGVSITDTSRAQKKDDVK